jgi:hypothetical protein
MYTYTPCLYYVVKERALVTDYRGVVQIMRTHSHKIDSGTYINTYKLGFFSARSISSTGVCVYLLYILHKVSIQGSTKNKEQYCR